MTLKIHAIQTGSVQIKTAQLTRKPGGLLRILTDTQWADWLPIYAWVIDHPEGLIVVDSGETAKTSEPAYFPWWHPYYRGSVRMNVRPEDEIGPQLKNMGIDANDVKTLILTHFHTDHAGGLHHLPKSEILVSAGEFRSASGLNGRLQGYLPNHWPTGFSPTPIPLEHKSFGSFNQMYPVTQAGDVTIVPTPGHTPNHVSVIVESEGINVFLAGDTSYSQERLLQKTPDGVSPRANVTLDTMNRILAYAEEHPLVYLPTHDPDSAQRLHARETLPALPELALEGGVL